MAYFKIRNITNDLNKRHPRANTVQTLETTSIMGPAALAINPGAEIIFESEYLPASAQKLRAGGFITVTEIDKNTYLKLAVADDNRKKEEADALKKTTSSEIDDRKKKKEQKETSTKKN